MNCARQSLPVDDSARAIRQRHFENVLCEIHRHRRSIHVGLLLVVIATHKCSRQILPRKEREESLPSVEGMKFGSRDDQRYAASHARRTATGRSALVAPLSRGQVISRADAIDRARPHALRGKGMSRRAELLAARIEEGAASLAAFAEGLSDAEWETPASPTDRRTVGQIVNHVALVYPIEVDLARAITSGNAVTDVTWQVVGELNAGHAREHAKVVKAEALELLRKNSRQAAETVRAFNDEELDRAAPFGLSFGAPVTAQFVIEDHAVRHSWHHLARIRTTLVR